MELLQSLVYLMKTVVVFVLAVTSQLRGLHGSLCNSHWRDMCSFHDAPPAVSSSYDVTSGLELSESASVKAGGCRAHIRHVICQMIRHTCGTSMNNYASPPCREACWRVRDTCVRRSMHGSISWAELLNCDALPTADSNDCQLSHARLGDTCACRVYSAPGIGRSVYYSKNFDYALQAQFTRVEHIPADNSPTVIIIRVLRVLKQKSLQLHPGKLTLWSEHGCYCSDLVPNKTYLFLGYENSEKRLLFNESCIAAPWKKRWPDYIQKWENRLRQRERRRNRNKASGDDVSHNDVTPHRGIVSKAVNPKPVDELQFSIEVDGQSGRSGVSSEARNAEQARPRKEEQGPRNKEQRRPRNEEQRSRNGKHVRPRNEDQRKKSAREERARHKERSV